MPTFLYAIPVLGRAESGEGDTRTAEVAESGVLDDSAVVDQISSGAADLEYEADMAALGPYHAELFSAEIEALAESSYDALPLFRIDSKYLKAGYYEIQSVDVSDVNTERQNVWHWQLTLTKRGTRNRHYRGIEPNLRQASHGFGTSTDRNISISADASKVQWYNGLDGERAIATATDTLIGEFGDMDVYDLEDGESAVDTETPTLLYDIPYELEARTDVRLYDTRGRGKYLEDPGAEGRTRAWEAVYDTQHDPSGELVADNGIVRLWMDEVGGTLAFEEWDDSGEEWGETTLEANQPSNIEVFDVDVREVGMVRDRVRLTFDVDGSLFACDAILEAGTDEVLFDIPDGEGSMPTDLEDWVDDIASETLIDTNASKTLVRRSEVSR